MTPALADDRRAQGFAPHHPWDRNFYLVMVALAWLGILRGFGGEIAGRIRTHPPAYPIIVHFHAVIFVGWLVLFTVQVLLIRSKKLSTHKKLGFGLVYLAGLMAVIGPATALTVQHRSIGRPDADFAFLSVQLIDILAFVGLTGAGLLLRKSPASHKRLILLGTIYTTGAGYARWLADGILAHLGMSYWHFWLALYLGPVVLALLAGLYDLVTRKKLHPSWILGAAYMFACEMLAVFLYFSPAWGECAKRMITAWPWGGI
jgi:hypothetical protein